MGLIAQLFSSNPCTSGIIAVHGFARDFAPPTSETHALDSALVLGRGVGDIAVDNVDATAFPELEQCSLFPFRLLT